METTNLTFEQQLILTLLDSFLKKSNVQSLEPVHIGQIKYLAKELSKGTEPTNRIHLNTKLRDCHLTVRVLNGLTYNGIETVGDLIQHTKSDLLKMRMVGVRSYREILEFLLDNNLRLRK